jgi:nitrite reductase/ring-hydroxylating ferredoxin subunit
MEEFVEVARASDVPIGRIKSIHVGERRIALYHTPKGFFASDGTCPHRGGPLAEGDIIGDEIVCPWHLWGFNIQTGLCEGNREISIVTHEVKVEDDRILVRLSPIRETTPSML